MLNTVPFSILQCKFERRNTFKYLTVCVELSTYGGGGCQEFDSVEMSAAFDILELTTGEGI